MSKIFPKPSYSADDLQRLHAEAADAVARLNRALAHAAPLTVLQADLPFRFVMSAPESPRPIPQPSGKKVEFRPSPPPSREDLIETARKLGMSEARIAERFGLSGEFYTQNNSHKIGIKAPIKKISLAFLGLVKKEKSMIT